jgi:hypothetical protein
MMRSGSTLTKFKQFTSRSQSFKYWRSMSAQPPQAEPTHLMEEEKLPYYNAKQFYPVHIGELLHSKYKVLGKLGYGSYSTVWLCHDNRYDLIQSHHDRQHLTYPRIVIINMSPSKSLQDRPPIQKQCCLRN